MVDMGKLMRAGWLATITALLLTGCGGSAAPTASSSGAAASPAAAASSPAAAAKPAAASAAASAGGSAKPAASAAAARKIKIAYSTQAASFLPIFVAKEAGIYQKHGLDVDISYTRDGPTTMAALVS